MLTAFLPSSSLCFFSNQEIEDINCIWLFYVHLFLIGQNNVQVCSFTSWSLTILFVCFVLCASIGAVGKYPGNEKSKQKHAMQLVNMYCVSTPIYLHIRGNFYFR